MKHTHDAIVHAHEHAHMVHYLTWLTIKDFGLAHRPDL